MKNRPTLDKLCFLFLALFWALPLTSQTPWPKDPVFVEYARKSFPEFKDLLSLPNDAHFPEDIEQNVRWCEAKFTERGFTTARLDTETVPLLLAEKKAENTTAKTVLIYLQVDGQPVDSSFWFQENPYEATLKRAAREGGWKAIEWGNLLG